VLRLELLLLVLSEEVAELPLESPSLPLLLGRKLLRDFVDSLLAPPTSVEGLRSCGMRLIGDRIGDLLIMLAELIILLGDTCELPIDVVLTGLLLLLLVRLGMEEFLLLALPAELLLLLLGLIDDNFV